MTTNKIKVFVRVRPLTAQEGINSCVDIKDNRELSLKHISGHTHQKTYEFDKVFGPDSNQHDIYKIVAEPLVQEVISGYNCTILAYGPTGTGKTYTMAGGNIDKTVNWTEDVHCGIIPRTIDTIFDLLKAQQVEHTVRISYLELYNEEIYDLLSPVEDKSKLKLYEDSFKKGSVIVKNSTEITLGNKAEVFRILEKGAEKRKVASTLKNAQSSRSHTVFCINVHTKENSIDGEDLLKTGKLYLVDLAGSENIKHSGVTKGRARETFSINQSLLTLGRCINKLTERSSHIPYRESKLTRLLQDSLGGRTKTTLIATVSPTYCSYDESINTLDYALRAKRVENIPQLNKSLSKMKIIKRYTEEIERLRAKFVDETIQLLQEEMANKEQLCDVLNINKEQDQIIQIKEDTIIALESQLSDALLQIAKLREDRDLSQRTTEQLSETERQLQNTASELLSVADIATSDTSKLHDKVEVLTDLSKHNTEAVEKHFAHCNEKMKSVSEKLQGSDEQINSFLQTMKNKLLTCTDTNTAYQDTLKTLASHINLWSGKFIRQINDLETGSQSFKVSSQSCQCKKSQLFKEMLKNCSFDFNATCIPFAKYVVDLGKTNAINFESLIETTNDLIQQNLQLNNRFTVDIGNTVSEVKENLKNRLDSCRSLEDEIESSVVQREESVQDFIQLRNEQFDALHSLISSIKNSVDEHDKNNAEYIKEQKKNIQVLKYGLEESARQCTSSDNVDKLLTQHSLNLSTMNSEQLRVLETARKTNRQTRDELTDTAEHVSIIREWYLAHLNKIKKKTEEECIVEVNSLEQTAKVNSEKYIYAAKELKDQIVAVSNEINKEVNELNNRMTITFDDMRVAVEENAETHKETQSFISTEIDSCREDMRRLFSGSLKEYKATGETPQRKTYQYPRSLAETKSRDILVEEFHHTCQNIPGGDDKENESANINSAKK